MIKQSGTALNSTPLKWDKPHFRGVFHIIVMSLYSAKVGVINLFQRIKEDIQAVKERDPAARNSLEVFFLYSGLHAIWYHRLSHTLYCHRWFGAARFVSQWARFWTGIEIHPGAEIGRGVFIDHGAGVVIGETAVVGNFCTIYQGATLGGTGKDTGKRHPTLGNNVLVGCGAKILGPFSVGDNSKIAANAVVLQEVPPNCTAVGVPAAVVRRDGKKVDGSVHTPDMDVIHMPDPVSRKMEMLLLRMEQLDQKIAKLESKTYYEHGNL